MKKLRLPIAWVVCFRKYRSEQLNHYARASKPTALRLKSATHFRGAGGDENTVDFAIIMLKHLNSLTISCTHSPTQVRVSFGQWEDKGALGPALCQSLELWRGRPLEWSMVSPVCPSLHDSLSSPSGPCCSSTSAAWLLWPCKVRTSEQHTLSLWFLQSTTLCHFPTFTQPTQPTSFPAWLSLPLPNNFHSC